MYNEVFIRQWREERKAGLLCERRIAWLCAHVGNWWVEPKQLIGKTRYYYCCSVLFWLLFVVNFFQQILVRWPLLQFRNSLALHAAKWKIAVSETACTAQCILILGTRTHTHTEDTEDTAHRTQNTEHSTQQTYCNPRVLESSLSWVSLLWILNQQVLNEMLGSGTHFRAVIPVVINILNLLKKNTVIFVVKWKKTRQPEQNKYTIVQNITTVSMLEWLQKSRQWSSKDDGDNKRTKCKW